jgi:hypothetical protein
VVGHCLASREPWVPPKNKRKRNLCPLDVPETLQLTLIPWINNVASTPWIKFIFSAQILIYSWRRNDFLCLGNKLVIQTYFGCNLSSFFICESDTPGKFPLTITLICAGNVCDEWRLWQCWHLFFQCSCHATA